MTTAFSLDEIREAAEKKYGHLDIPFGENKNVRLINLLQLGKTERDKITALEKDDEVDQQTYFTEVIKIAATNKTDANSLLKEIGDNLGVLAILFNKYTGVTEVGEA